MVHLGRGSAPVRGRPALPPALNAHSTQASHGGGSCTQEWPAQLGFVEQKFCLQLAGDSCSGGSGKLEAYGQPQTELLSRAGELLKPRAAAAAQLGANTVLQKGMRTYQTSKELGHPYPAGATEGAIKGQWDCSTVSPGISLPSGDSSPFPDPVPIPSRWALFPWDWGRGKRMVIRSSLMGFARDTSGKWPFLTAQW